MIRRSLDEIRARARAELASNPTITVYRMVNGVEKRRAANPFLGMRNHFVGIEAAMDSVTDAIAGITMGMWDFSAAVRKAIGGDK